MEITPNCCKKCPWRGPRARTTLPKQMQRFPFLVLFQQCLKTIIIIVGNLEVCLSSVKSQASWKCAAAVVDRIVAPFLVQLRQSPRVKGCLSRRMMKATLQAFEKVIENLTPTRPMAEFWTFGESLASRDKTKLNFQDFWVQWDTARQLFVGTWTFLLV